MEAPTAGKMTVALRIPPWLMERVKDIAKGKDKTHSRVICDAVERMVKEYDKRRERP